MGDSTSHFPGCDIDTGGTSGRANQDSPNATRKYCSIPGPECHASQVGHGGSLLYLFRACRRPYRHQCVIRRAHGSFSKFRRIRFIRLLMGSTRRIPPEHGRNWLGSGKMALTHSPSLVLVGTANLTQSMRRWKEQKTHQSHRSLDRCPIQKLKNWRWVSLFYIRRVRGNTSLVALGQYSPKLSVLFLLTWIELTGSIPNAPREHTRNITACSSKGSWISYIAITRM
jgi:hypothetical protein